MNMRKKYQTFYTCPGCGQLVPSATEVCDCGYVFVDVYKTSIFQLIFFTGLFVLYLGLTLRLDYALLTLLFELAQKIGIIHWVFHIRFIGSWIENILFCSIVFSLFSMTCTWGINLFSKFSGKRAYQSALILCIGSAISSIFSLINLIWAIVDKSPVFFWIIMLIQTAYLFFLLRAPYKKLKQEKLAASATHSH